MTEKDIGKGNLLISYLFNSDNEDCADLLGSVMCEERMKRDLQELAEKWKQKGFIRRYVIADDECISTEKLSLATKLKQYEDLGTVEELEQAMGKMTAKSRIIKSGKYYCCICERYAQTSGHCSHCG